MQKGIHDLFEERLTRKQFLQYLLGGLLAVIGVQSVLTNLSRLQTPQQQAADPTQRKGFGTSKFGV